jgi:hypothetical protein
MSRDSLANTKPRHIMLGTMFPGRVWRRRQLLRLRRERPAAWPAGLPVGVLGNQGACVTPGILGQEFSGLGGNWVAEAPILFLSSAP